MLICVVFHAESIGVTLERIGFWKKNCCDRESNPHQKNNWLINDSFSDYYLQVNVEDERAGSVIVLPDDIECDVTEDERFLAPELSVAASCGSDSGSHLPANDGDDCGETQRSSDGDFQFFSSFQKCWFFYCPYCV